MTVYTWREAAENGICARVCFYQECNQMVRIASACHFGVISYATTRSQGPLPAPSVEGSAAQNANNGNSCHTLLNFRGNSAYAQL